MLGSDTHRDAHVAVVLRVTGAVLATDEFPANAAGYRYLLKWARELGVVRWAGVDGTGSYGASLSRYWLAQGVEVLDVNWMDRSDRRRRGKSDPLDAQNAARAVLSGRARARAKAGDGPVQIARMYKLTKASAAKAGIHHQGVKPSSWPVEPTAAKTRDHLASPSQPIAQTCHQ